MFASLMSAVGLLIFRLFIARPVARVVRGASLRGVNRALALALALAIVIVPVYLDMATAQFALRSAFDLGNVIPLMGTSAFGRGYLDLELILLCLALAASVAVWLDRPQRAQRSVAELLAMTGALASVAALLVVPGLIGHASQKSPRGVSIALDWTHLLAGSTWIGGLIGLTVLGFSVGARERVRALVTIVPRFSNVALASVAALVSTGAVAALLRLPTLASLWDTGYGQALVVKIAFLIGALFLAANNLLRSRPRLQAARSRASLGDGAALMLRRFVGGEVALVLSAVFAAGLLSSLAPPSSALGRIGSAAADVGPGPVARTLTHGAYRLAFQIAPNKAAVPNAFQIRIERDGRPVTGAGVTGRFDMLDMEMQQQEYQLNPSSPGIYSRSAPSLVMVGHWALTFTITPPGGNPFQVLILDKANG
jgi:copper transport protein